MKDKYSDQSAVLAMSPDMLNLSVRSRNCLKNAGIKTMRELVSKSEKELLKYRNFGRKSLNEIKNGLSELGLTLNMKDLDNIDFEIPDEKIPERNYTKLRLFPLKELALSPRSYNSLTKAGVCNIGELLEKSNSELLEIDGFGKNCLNEISDKLSALGLSRYGRLKVNSNILTDDLRIRDDFIRTLPISIKKIHLKHLLNDALLQAVQKSSNNRPVLSIDSFFLNEKETRALSKSDPPALIAILNIIEYLFEELHFEKPRNMIKYISNLVGDRDYQIYMKRIREKKTLEGIAGELSITRERVRQIETSVERKIKKSLLRVGITAYMSRWVEYLNKYGSVVTFNNAIREMNEDIGYKDLKILCRLSNSIIPIPIYLFESNGEQMVSKFKEEELLEAYKMLLSDVINYMGETKDELRESLRIEVQYDQAVEDYCLNKFIADKAFVKDGKVIGVKGRHIQNVESTFLLAGKELHFDEAENIFKELFNEDISFRGMFGRSENIVLWGRGTYIHKDIIDLNLEPLEKVYDLIQDALKNIQKKTTATAIFENNKELMKFMKIPTPQALYSVLRLNDDCNFLYRKYPDIEHSENAEYSRKERVDELNEYFLSADKPLYKEELVDYFVKKRGMREYQIFFAIDRCPDIYRIGDSRYIHAKVLGITRKQIKKITQDIEGALLKNDPLILGEIIHELDLPEINPYHWNRQLVASIIKKNTNLKMIYHAAVTNKNNDEINNVEELILHIVKTGTKKFTRESLITHLRYKKITSSMRTIELFIRKYGFLLVKQNGF